MHHQIAHDTKQRQKKRTLPYSNSEQTPEMFYTFIPGLVERIGMTVLKPIGRRGDERTLGGNCHKDD